MGEAKHTPGLWEVDRLGVVVNGVLRRGTNYRRIAHTKATTGYANPDLDAENDANTRLIAAAPDLLRAAKAALFVLNIVYSREPGTNEGGAIAVLKAAIAKAEGWA